MKYKPTVFRYYVSHILPQTNLNNSLSIWPSFLLYQTELKIINFYKNGSLKGEPYLNSLFTTYMYECLHNFVFVY